MANEPKNADLLQLSLQIEHGIIIGEQIKGGTFRPCLETIPASTIEGALFHHLNVQIPAVGVFESGSYERREFTYALRDRSLNISTLPVTTDYLAPREDKYIRATIYLPYSENVRAIEPKLQGMEFRMGAMRNKGFGLCRVHDITPVEAERAAIVQGFLNVKLFETDCSAFGVTALAPNYGYLFKLTPNADYSLEKSLPRDGVYQRALLQESLVKAPRILIKEETYYDE